jgi:hypothetical protein
MQTAVLHERRRSSDRCPASGLRFFHVKNDRIILQRGHWDKLSFLSQLGLPLPKEISNRTDRWASTWRARRRAGLGRDDSEHLALS